MSVFGQMEADWRDQQSGAREQQYDEDLQSEDQTTPIEASAGHKLPTSAAVKDDLGYKSTGS